MAQIRKRKLSTLVLCIVLLLILCGCQETRQFEAEQLDYLLLDDETVAHMESLYGVKKEKAIKKLGLSEKDVSIEEGNGIVHIAWTGLAHINEPTAVPEKEFTKEMDIAWKTADLFGFPITSHLFCGIKYTCECDNAEEMADIAEALYLAAEGKYGLENHGHISMGKPLCSEGAFDAIRAYEDDIQKYGIGLVWSEAWLVGEVSYLEMTVWDGGEHGDTFSVELRYSVLPEEWPRFNPEYSTRISFGRTIKQDYD